MIVPSMTYEEVINEIKKDIPQVFGIADRKDHKVRRIVLKAQTFPVRLHSFVTSRNKNRWLLTWEAHSKKNVGDNALYSMTCIFNDHNGRIAVMASFQNWKNPIFLIFLPHFFQRFANRMEINETGEELIRRFFQYNSNLSISTKEKEFPNGKYATEATGTSPEGVSLGYRLEDGNFFFKTFITYDMAKGDQAEAFRQSELRRVANREELIKSVTQ